MAIKKNSKFSKGISAIEILIVIFIIGVVLTSLLGLATLSLWVSVSTRQTAQANHIAQETIEAVRNFRDGTSWDVDGLGSKNYGVSYFPQKTADTPPKWNLIEGEENINVFVRKVVFAKAYRDANDNIAETGTEDPNTKKIIINVSWQEKGKTFQVELITYLTNWPR